MFAAFYTTEKKHMESIRLTNWDVDALRKMSDSGTC